MSTITTETWTGSNGAAWPAQWAAGSTPTGASAQIQGNTGRLTLGSAGSSADRVARRISTSAADVVITVKFRVSHVGQYPAIYVRSTNTSLDTQGGYCMDIDPTSNFWRLQVGSSYSRSNLTNTVTGTTANVTQAFSADTWYWAKFGAVGSSIKGKVWADGASEPAWQWTSTDTTHTSSNPYGFTVGWSASTGRYTEFDDFTAETAFPTESVTADAATTVTISATASLGFLDYLDAATSITLDTQANLGLADVISAATSLQLDTSAAMSVYGEVGGPQARFGQNYSFDLFKVEVDQRGFLVGQSRIGVDLLTTTVGEWVDVTGGFASCVVALACSVDDGLFLRPEVSSVTLTSPNFDLFRTYDGRSVRVRYDDTIIFQGVVTESGLTSDIGWREGEEFQVALTGRGYETIKNGLPAAGTANAVWSSASGTEGAVVQWPGEKARGRAVSITGRPVVAEDGRADVQLDELVGTTTDVSGTQGELLQDLANRVGLLVDQSSGTTVAFRSYQSSPVWNLLPEDVRSGYELAVDRSVPGGVTVVREGDEDYRRSFRAGAGRNVTTQTIATETENEWDMASVPAYAPLISEPTVHLARAIVGRVDRLPLTPRLPMLVNFDRDEDTRYSAAVVGMSHTITPERWMIELTGEPAHLITRVGDLAPLAPTNVHATIDNKIVTVTWDQPTGGVTPYGWEVWFTDNPDHDGVITRAVSPNSAGVSAQKITTYTNSVDISVLANDKPYRFTVYAISEIPNVRSAPSLPANIDVPAPDGLALSAQVLSNTEIELVWSWVGVATPTGYKVGRDGFDSTGYGAFETVDASDVFSRTFDKLIPGTTYTVYCAAMDGATELERITLTVATTTETTDPDDPGTPVDPNRRIALVGDSGLLFNSIYFEGGSASNAGNNAFSAERGRQLDGSLWFLSRGSWDEFRYGWGDTGSMLNAGKLVVVTLPFAPQSEGTAMNTRGAANNYAAQQQAFGSWLVSQGYNKEGLVLRLGWEANGNWYPWSIQYGGVAAYKQAFINTVVNIRAGGATNVRFAMCFNKGPSQSGADYAAFPGAQYCDVIGIDQYDQWNPADDDGEWATEINKTPALQNIRDFAVANGIMWSLDEGGNTWRSGRPAYGQDNPFYWEKIWEFFTDPDNYPSCAWHNTFNHVGAPSDYKHDFANNPVSFAVYKTTFGGF